MPCFQLTRRVAGSGETPGGRRVGPLAAGRECLSLLQRWKGSYTGKYQYRPNVKAGENMAESKRGRDIVKQAKAEIEPLTLEQVDDLIRRREPMTLVDVREGDEWRAGRPPRALPIPPRYLEPQVDEKLPAHDAPGGPYCARGNRPPPN